MRAGPAAWLGVIATLAIALVAGCGVPTDTGVQVDGPVAGVDPPGGSDPRPPPGPDEAESAEQLVRNFLQAAATDPANPVEHLRAFLHSDHADQWEPDSQVLLVREEEMVPTQIGPARHRVTLDVRVVGVLRQGMVQPRESPETRSFEFEVVTETRGQAGDGVDVGVGETRFRILDFPEVVMLSDRALKISPNTPGYLAPSPVYFWDHGGSVLVPDLRWLPTALHGARAVQAKLAWLVGGPAPWLAAVEPLPGDVDLEGNVVWMEDRLTITLTPAAADLDRGWLDPQIWWTLHSEVRDDSEVWLSIDEDQRQVRPAEGVNPVVGLAPASFVVLDGEVVPYVPADGPLPAALVEDLGVRVHTAAVNRDGAAALVHLDLDGSYRLSLATADGLVTTRLVGQSMTRPMWLPYSGGTGLVIVEGDLYRFRAGDDDPVELRVPGLAEPVTAMAAAPDGRRLALIAGDRLFVTSVVRRDDDVVGLNPPTRLPLAASDLAGVAFLQESWLAVLGRDGNQSLFYEVTIDGALERPLPGPGLGAPEAVTNVVGYPGAPAQRGELMYEADGNVWRYNHPSPPELVTLEDLGIDPQDGSPQPRAPLFVE